MGIVVQRDKSSCCDCEHSQNQHTIYEHDEDSWVKAQQKHSKLNTESICYTTYSALFSGWALLLKLQKSIHPCEVFWVCCCMKSIFKSFLWTFRKSWLLLLLWRKKQAYAIDWWLSMHCIKNIKKKSSASGAQLSEQPNSKPPDDFNFLFLLFVYTYSAMGAII